MPGPLPGEPQQQLLLPCDPHFWLLLLLVLVSGTGPAKTEPVADSKGPPPLLGCASKGLSTLSLSGLDSLIFCPPS
eukprot:664558-Karenia_brevis.AAC.1